MPEIEEWHWFVGWEQEECFSQPWICIRIRDDLLLGWSTQYKEWEAFDPRANSILHRPEQCKGRHTK